MKTVHQRNQKVQIANKNALLGKPPGVCLCARVCACTLSLSHTHTHIMLCMYTTDTCMCFPAVASTCEFVCVYYGGERERNIVHLHIYARTHAHTHTTHTPHTHHTHTTHTHTHTHLFMAGAGSGVEGNKSETGRRPMSAPSKRLEEMLNDPAAMVCGHVCTSVSVLWAVSVGVCSRGRESVCLQGQPHTRR
jgi:hypothetical protein